MLKRGARLRKLLSARASISTRLAIIRSNLELLEQRSTPLVLPLETKDLWDLVSTKKFKDSERVAASPSALSTRKRLTLL